MSEPIEIAIELRCDECNGRQPWTGWYHHTVGVVAKHPIPWPLACGHEPDEVGIIYEAECICDMLGWNARVTL